MVFFLEFKNIWQKSEDFWFSNFFLSHMLVWIFLGFCFFVSISCSAALLAGKEGRPAQIIKITKIIFVTSISGEMSATEI